jgi:hypothetical protein
MPKARHLYMAEWFYPDPSSGDGLRKETDRIIAYDDAEAIREAAPIGRGTPSFWLVRKRTRTSDDVIYDSRR